MILSLKKRKVIGPPGGPLNLKVPKILYRLLLKFGKNFQSNPKSFYNIKKYIDRECPSGPLGALKRPECHIFLKTTLLKYFYIRMKICAKF